MTSVLITTFEPYDDWSSNASWLALVELTKDMPELTRVTTRLYPVDFDEVPRKLSEDLTGDYDLALHLGQAPGAARVQLEAIGLNVGAAHGGPPGEEFPLVTGGPLAYRSSLPLARWAAQLCEAGIPASVSYHAGTFLCNATLYHSHHIAAERGLRTRSTFIHLPLDPSQVVATGKNLPSLPAAMSAQAVRVILEGLRLEA